MLLVVITMAGGPTSSLACELWCGGMATEHHPAGCDHGHISVPEGPHVEAPPGCHDAVGIAPFLLEDRRVESGPAASEPAVLPLGWIPPDIERVPAGSHVFQVLLPRGPTLYSVLRL